MFEEDSRYYEIETATIAAEDGTLISYKRRRFLPNTENMDIETEVVVTEGQRLDSIAASIYGDSEQFWRICDANNAMNPFELTARIGSKLKIATPNILNS